AIIVMETGRTSILPKHVKRLELRPWSQKAERYAKNAVTTAATKLSAAFDPIEEFPKVFPKEKDISLPPLREINHNIVVMKVDFMDVPVPIKPKEKFLEQLRQKLEPEEKTGRIYKSNNPSCCAMFTIAKTSDA